MRVQTKVVLVRDAVKPAVEVFNHGVSNKAIERHLITRYPEHYVAFAADPEQSIYQGDGQPVWFDVFDRVLIP